MKKIGLLYNYRDYRKFILLPDIKKIVLTIETKVFKKIVLYND